MSVLDNHDFWCDSLIDREPVLPCNCYKVGQVAPTSDVSLCVECISSPCKCPRYTTS
jgi:hypothetical protein